MKPNFNPAQTACSRGIPSDTIESQSGGSPVSTVKSDDPVAIATQVDKRREAKRRRTLETVSIYPQLPDEAEVATLAVIRIVDISPATYWRRVRAGTLPKPRNGRTRVGALRAALAARAAAPTGIGRTREATKRSLEVRRLRREAERQASGVQTATEAT